MPKPTYRECYAAALITEGFTRDPQARTGKYHVYVPPAKPTTALGKLLASRAQNVYLGKAGAFRIGLNATNSRDAASTRFAQQLLATGRELYAKSASRHTCPDNELISLRRSAP